MNQPIRKHLPLRSTKPSMEEIRLWSQSFDKLMRNPAGRNVFREFLRTEYSEENMLFWLACEDLKQEINKGAIEEKARSIYEDYISILSPKEVGFTPVHKGPFCWFCSFLVKININMIFKWIFGFGFILFLCCYTWSSLSSFFFSFFSHLSDLSVQHALQQWHTSLKSLKRTV